MKNQFAQIFNNANSDDELSQINISDDSLNLLLTENQTQNKPQSQEIHFDNQQNNRNSSFLFGQCIGNLESFNQVYKNARSQFVKQKKSKNIQSSSKQQAGELLQFQSNNPLPNDDAFIKRRQQLNDQQFQWENLKSAFQNFIISPQQKSTFKTQSNSKEKQNILTDPLLLQKQELLIKIFQLVKFPLTAIVMKNHCMLEDALLLNLIYIPELRQKNQLFSQALYNHVVSNYGYVRSQFAFQKRLTKLLCQNNHLTLEELEKIYNSFQELTQEELKITYLKFCKQQQQMRILSDVKLKKTPADVDMVIQSIIDRGGSQELKLNDTVKQLLQYVNLSSKEIQSDIECFENEQEFIKMILQLINTSQEHSQEQSV